MSATEQVQEQVEAQQPTEQEQSTKKKKSLVAPAWMSQVAEALNQTEAKINALEDRKELFIEKINDEKKVIIKGTAEFLKSIMPEAEHKKIGSLMDKQFAGKNWYSKSWLYEQLPEGCIDEERSNAIREGRNMGKDKNKNPAGGGGGSSGGERQSPVADNSASDEQTEQPTTDSTGTEQSSAGTLPQSPLGSSNPNQYLTIETLKDICAEVVASGVDKGEVVEIPKPIFEKLALAVPRVAAR